MEEGGGPFQERMKTWGLTEDGTLGTVEGFSGLGGLGERQKRACQPWGSRPLQGHAWGRAVTATPEPEGRGAAQPRAGRGVAQRGCV